MINKKITRVLAIFFPDDRKQFKKFLLSAYHTSDQFVLPLYEFILENHFSKNARPECFTELAAFQCLYPAEDFSKKKFDNKCSDLLKLAELFLINQDFDNNKFYKEKLLAQAYARREKQHAEGRFNKMNKVLDATTTKDEVYFLRKTELLVEQYFSSVTGKFNQKKAGQLFDELITCSNTLICLLHINLALEGQARSHIFNKNFHAPITDVILDFVDQVPNHILQLYKLAYLVVKEEKLADYKEFRSRFFDSFSDLNRNAQNVFSTTLLNFSTRNIRKKISLEEVLATSKTIIRNNLLLEEGYFPSAYFANICILSTETNDSEWTRELLDFGLKQLNPLDKKATLAKCWAYYYFSVGQYDSALDKLSAVPSSRINDKLQASVLELRCLYEQQLKGEDTLFEYKLEAYRKLIYRKVTLNPLIKEQNLNFLKVITKLYNSITLSENSKQLLTDQVQRFPKVCARHWLLQIIKKHTM